jgi:hypothetical protein
MLLKAVLVQNRVRVFEQASGKSIGFEKCVNICTSHHDLTGDEAGIMRAINSMRDAAQHWYIFISEDMLYLNTRALITTFDDYMRRALNDDLSCHIPARVLPISTMPPGDFEFLVDREYELIRDLLMPGRRARNEARARIRSLLAMEAITVDTVEVSEKDINRIETAIRQGQPFLDVFPRLATVGTDVDGEGVTMKVHLTKKEGAPIRYIGGDDPAEAAAVREVDLQKKFHFRAAELAKKLGLSTNKAKVLRDQLSIDADPSCCHIFEFGAQRIPCFSDNAYRSMRAWLDANKIEDLWAARKGRKAIEG